MYKYITFTFMSFLLISFYSCSQKTIKGENNINIAYIIIGDYIFEKKESEFENPIKKNFMYIIPKVIRPISFKFMNSEKVKSILAKKNVNLSFFNINQKNLIKLGNILKNADLILIIKPIYMNVESKFFEEKKLKCSKKYGYGLIQVVVFDNTKKKIILNKNFEASAKKQICQKDIFPDVTSLSNKKIREEIIDKIFKQVTDRLVNTI